MKPLILLIHTQAHVNALPPTAQAIIASGYDRCWVVISPAIAVDANAASEKFDTEIAAQRAAELAAAGRGDYEAAAGYKLAREGKQLDRDKAIADAWKSVPEEDRKLAYKAKLAPLFEAFQGKVAARMVSTQEHYAAAQWISMLNALSGVWPKELVHGEYMVGWPGAIPTGRVSLPPKDETEVTPPAVIEAAGRVQERLPKISKPTTRREELEAMHRHTLQATARDLGLNAGKKTPELIDDILAAEASKAAPTPELAEY